MEVGKMSSVCISQLHSFFSPKSLVALNSSRRAIRTYLGNRKEHHQMGGQGDARMRTMQNVCSHKRSPLL